MTNKKEIITASLLGNAKNIQALTEECKQVDVYIDGILDTQFLTETLQAVSIFMKATDELFNAFNNMLGISLPEKQAKEKDDSGAKWSAEEILKHCELVDNVLKLPAVTFNKKSYAKAKGYIEEAGGKWQGGKTQGFVFDFNATRVFNILKQGKRCNLQQEFQFFETPEALSDWLVMLAGGIADSDTVLEPSAGRGALIKAIHRANPNVVVNYYELMPENREFLQKISGIVYQGDDFMQPTDRRYNKIIANPPFTGNLDVKHTLRMYELLSPAGTMAVITSQHWKFASEKICVDFRDFLSQVDAKVIDIERGQFNESGTSIPTTAIVINKPHATQ